MFIYDRKEVTVLTVLGVLVALFAFTLGVHLGKKVRGGLGSWTGPDAQSVDTATDKIPEPGDLTEQSKGAFGAVDDTLSHMLRDEVEKAGLKLDQGRQIDLPKGTVSKEGGATTEYKAKDLAEAPVGQPATQPAAPAHSEAAAPGAQKSDSAHAAPKVDSVPSAPKGSAPAQPAASEAAIPSGKFTLQVGSHPSLAESVEQMDRLKAQGLEAFRKSVDLREKGLWHRVYLGGYVSKEEAEKAGAKFRDQHLVESFVVTRSSP
jgi:cell division septation protein DedD